MPDSIAKQMADIAKQFGFTNPVVMVVSSDAGVVVHAGGAFDPSLGNEIIERAQVAIKEFLESTR